MYDKKFFDVSRQGMQDSAAALVPILCAYLNIDKDSVVLDVGCGEGWWAKEFATHRGCTVRGIDSSGADIAPGVPVREHDLRTPIPDEVSGFDFVVCLEVAEHLPAKRAESFIAELCGLAGEAVIFYAAIPGQGGTGHVNEQWPRYWAHLFNNQDFIVTGAFRQLIWEDERIENWYRQNLLIATPSSKFCRLPPELCGTMDCPIPDPPLPLVHPVLYDARRA